MSDQQIALTRRRALTALGVIGVGGAAAGAGTFAAFQDSAETSGTLTAGELSLSVGDTDAFSFQTSEIVPGDSGTPYTTLEATTTGIGSATLDIAITSVDISDLNSGSTAIASNLELKMWLQQGDGTGDSTFDPGSGDIGLATDGSMVTSSSPGLSYNTVDSFGTVGTEEGTPFREWTGVGADLTSNDFAFFVAWDLPYDEANPMNDVQNDEITINFDITLTQANPTT